MFQDCTSLTQAPLLPATTLANSCYFSMFQGCTSLTQAPLLPATKLDSYCYDFIFENCTSISGLKYNMPNLTFDEVANAIQQWLFGDMYDGNLRQIQCSDKILNVIWDLNTYNWTITEG